MLGLSTGQLCSLAQLVGALDPEWTVHVSWSPQGYVTLWIETEDDQNTAHVLVAESEGWALLSSDTQVAATPESILRQRIYLLTAANN